MVKSSTPDLRPILKKPSLPEWVCKCEWRSTATLIIVPARNESEAWDRAWKRVARTEGGDSCLKVTVLRQK